MAMFISGSTSSTGSFGSVKALGTGQNEFLNDVKVGTGTNQAYLGINAPDNGNSRLYFGDNSDAGVGFIDYDHGTRMDIGVGGAAKVSILESNGNVGIGTTSPAAILDVSGSVFPAADNFHDLGSTSKRWANLYVADMQMNNEGTDGNEVDGTTGNWSIQEGEEDLYLLNRKSGKKYKFKLEEVT